MIDRGRSPRNRTNDPVAAVRSRFLARGNPYGCAESVLLALQDHFGLDDPSAGAAAMALNGGVAYSGGTCGALTGAALAVGRFAAERIPNRRRAKLVARRLTAAVVADFEATFGATDCRALTGVDLRAPGGHEAFIAEGAWRVDCTRRLERVVGRLAGLADAGTWTAATTRPGDESGHDEVEASPAER